jgi:capsular exopolysaccharide synthesis family protein
MINSSEPQSTGGQIIADPAPVSAAAAALPVILEYLRILRRHVKLIAGVLAIALVCALIATLITTPLYTAQVRLAIAREEANVTNVKSLEPDSIGSGAEFYATQYSLLNARSLAERVSVRMKLSSNPIFLTAYRLDKEASLLAPKVGGQLSPDDQKRLEHRIVDKLVDNIAVNPVRASALIDIAFTSSSPALAAEIPNVWVDEFVQQSMDRRLMSTSIARAFLEKRLTETRQRLEQSDRNRVEFARKNAIVSLSEVQSLDGKTRTTQTLVSANLEALNRELVVATTARVLAEGQFDAARSSTSSNGMLQTATTAQLRERRAELAAEYSKIIERFDSKFPDARLVATQIATYDASIKKEQENAFAGFSAALESAKNRENDLKERVDLVLQRYNAESSASTTSNIYQRDVDTNRQLYDALLQRYKEIGIGAVGASNIAVIDAATVHRLPSSPKLRYNLVIAMLGGLLVAGTLVFVLENLDEGIRTPLQISDTLRLSLLGAPPLVSGNTPVLDLQNPKSALSEAFLTVRTNLGFTTEHGAPRSFCVTSTLRAEGKTTTTIGLGLMLARAGRSVVLVDVDLRIPSLANQLGVANVVGVSNYLAGDDAWMGAVCTTSLPGVMVLPSGPIPPSAPDLLSGDRLKQLVAALLERYDHVILDTPPMLGLSDGPLIARTVEGTVFVVKAEATPLRAVQAAVQRLQDSKARIFGAVLTMYKSPHAHYGYVYDYAHAGGEAKSAAGRL